MRGVTMARVLRPLLVGCFVGAVLLAVVNGVGAAVPPDSAFAVTLPFVAVALAVAGLGALSPYTRRWMRRLSHDTSASPYSVLAEAAARIRAVSLDEALPGLARVLAHGTGAAYAEIWLAVAQQLVSAARHPPVAEPPGAAPRRLDSLAALLNQPDVDYAVPVLDGNQLRAALVIGKPFRSVTPADQRLMRDVANEAGLLLRGVALNATLRERVARAEELAAEMAASRLRLTSARDLERRRLVTELDNAITNRLAAIRADISDATDAATAEQTEGALLAVRRAQGRLDELLERFRAIARGVYPSVLRGQGLFSALDELATDLPRPVRFTGTLPERLAWEIESGIYFLAAAALHQLAGQAGDAPVTVHLAHEQGRLSVRVEDASPSVSPTQLRAALAHEEERLTALGGQLSLSENQLGALSVLGWLPEQLEPAVAPSDAAAVQPITR